MSEPETEEYFRREAMGAFAHEVRTPLTSIRMVMELARRQSTGGQLVLDRELSEMLATSVDDLQRLADDLQEASRLERGKLAIGTGPCDLAAAIAAANDLILPRVSIECRPPDGVVGAWDAARLVRSVAGFAESANRIGDGSGRVRVRVKMEVLHAAVALHFESGVRGPDLRPIAADAGFSYFRARLFVLAMGGSVTCLRSERHATISVRIPYAPQRGKE